MNLRSLLVILAVVAAVGCATSPAPSHEVSMRLATPNGGGGTLTVSSDGVDSLVGAVMSGSACRGLDLDADIEAVLTRLDRGGSRARVTVTGEDGRLQARRSGGQMVLDFTATGGGGVRLELPWGVAECLLGRADTLEEALHRHRRPSAKLELTSSDGETTRLELALR